MTQYGRPNADTFNSESWTSPAWSVLDEVIADDADKVVSVVAPSSDLFEVALASVEDPLSAIGHIVRYRFQKNAAGGATIDLVARLMQGGTQIARWEHGNISNGWVLAEQTLSAAEANSITNYADLRVQITANQV